MYKKTSLFLAAMILIGIALSVVASRNTFQLAARYRELQSGLAALERIPLKIPANLAQDQFREVDLNAAVFKVISESGRRHNIKIKNINAPVMFRTGDLSILTKEIVLEGAFIGSMKCLDDATQSLEHIKISSVKFQRDPSPKTNTLYTQVYFQTIRENDQDANN